jgi:hypothetical protein
VLIDWGIREKGSNINPVQVQSKFLHKFLSWEVDYVHDGTSDKEPTFVRWEFKDTTEEVDSPKLRQALEAASFLATQHPNGISRWDLAQKMEVSENTAKGYLMMLVSRGVLYQSRSGTGRGQRNLFKVAPNGKGAEKGAEGGQE